MEIFIASDFNTVPQRVLIHMLRDIHSFVPCKISAISCTQEQLDSKWPYMSDLVVLVVIKK